MDGDGFFVDKNAYNFYVSYHFFCYIATPFADNSMNMKKYIILLTAALLFLAQPHTFAQSKGYEPLTTWPYVYEDFCEGWITTISGGRIQYDKINVNLANGRVHYIDNGTIMEAAINTIGLLNIGSDAYVSAGGRMVRILKNTQYAAVVLSSSVDFDTLNKANIGYGTSATASTQGLNPVALSSTMDFSINKSLDDVKTDKDSGTPLPIHNVMGIYYKGSFYPAVRNEILGIPGIDKEVVKNYMKTEKIKLTSVDDLGKLVDYLYQY